ncbi:TonB-dependent receptor [Sphingomonas sabuli]|uniref:TonB-dependent receptor n=1 Tax=Sphingomonas sabuli TaxID=2764186 RepID=A0A7G9KZS6_9SPHN|nr:TonB-dependent receptor [Sphingomonas sabuli]QNM81875.1 TonB-dependent receptor [Sphingomonas sabuli]
MDVQIEQPAEVVVIGRRLETQADQPVAGAIVLDTKAIDRAASGRLEGVLAQVPGLQSFRRSDSRSANPSAQGLTLRGLGGNASSRTLVLLDGIPVAEPFFGFVPFSAIDPLRIDRISILRGAGGGAFGSAVAGTINLSTRPPDRRDTADATVAIASPAAATISAGAVLRQPGFVLTVDGRGDWGRGFWTTPADQRVPASVRAAFESRSLDVRAIGQVGSGEVQARLRRFDDERTLRFKGADSSMDGTDLSLRYASADDIVTLAAWRQKRDFTTVVISGTSFVPVLDQYATPATSIGALARWRPVQGLAVGGDIKTSKGTAFERALSAQSGMVTADRANGGRVVEASAFAEGEERFGAITLAASGRVTRWTLDRGRSSERDGSGALQFDHRFDERHGTALSGRATASWSTDRWTARVAAYRGERLPTLNELYRGFTVFPVQTLANPALDPERLVGAEIGTEFRPVPDARIAATVFANRLNGAIANVTIGPNLRERRNIDALTSRGIELDGSIRRGPWNVQASASLLRARVRDGALPPGLDPAQVPRFTASATVQHTAGPWTAAATLRHFSPAYEDDLNLHRLPAATTLDAVVRRRIGERFEIAVRAENMFDTRVVTRNQAGSIDLDAPRTVWLSLGFAPPR